MKRVDYDRSDVERLRAEVREHVVPLGLELHRRQAATLKIDKVMAWDEPMLDLSGNPAPAGDHDWMLARATEMFDAMGEGLGDFFRLMNEGGFLDLKSRKGKAGGGFCTSFPTHGMPFVFANFNGTKGDVEVFTHEMGHAFQGYSSRGQALSDYLWPTLESCEIHSMSLEFLTMPHMERFFGDDAERFRRIHLTESLLFLPYGCAVDHFQHEIYARPEMTPAERHAVWREMERTYLPWRDWGDLAHPGKGGRWQVQRHVYLSPFYYVDYVLAQTCALQFWARAESDPSGAMKDYVALCKRGGEAPFQALARSAGLTSPFDAGCLAGVVARARRAL
jgi:M3 family oligoendopeptidase